MDIDRIIESNGLDAYRTSQHNPIDWLKLCGAELVIEHQTQLTRLPAIAPESGGDGEWKKSHCIMDTLMQIESGTDFNFNSSYDCKTDRAESLFEFIKVLNSPDPRVSKGYRPNIIAKIPGKISETLWIMGHMDVVPAGDISKWKTDPFKVTVDGDRIYGRGCEDNQQAIVSMLLVAQALQHTGKKPYRSLGLLFVSDEECGSIHGMEYILKNRCHIRDDGQDIFNHGDLVLVPDMGAPDGSIIEIAEKGILWLKVEVEGKQCHASTPNQGINALTAAAYMILVVNDATAKFNAVDPIFDSPSSFTPTRHEENVPNVNTVPGKDVFYIDCRVLPCYSFDEVESAITSKFQSIAKEYGVTVKISRTQDSPAAPPTSADSKVVRLLTSSIRKMRGIEPICVGVGGGTVAATFRRAGIDAAVWGTQEGKMHSPNEYSKISNTIADAEVILDMLFREE